jgi:hypothetical protein
VSKRSPSMSNNQVRSPVQTPPTPPVDPATEPGDFLEETRAFWQSRTDRVLTREDAREIIENMTGFFRVLLEWDRAKRSKHTDSAD